MKNTTLDDFIKAKLTRYEAGELFDYPRNAWVVEPGFTPVYVRFSKRRFDDVIVEPVLDIANIEAKKPGQGAFTRLIDRLKHTYPKLNFFVECVLDQRFRRHLVKLGFKKLDGGDFSIAVDSYYLKAQVLS